jgi:hypothetical protein
VGDVTKPLGNAMDSTLVDRLDARCAVVAIVQLTVRERSEIAGCACVTAACARQVDPTTQVLWPRSEENGCTMAAAILLRFS